MQDGGALRASTRELGRGGEFGRDGGACRGPVAQTREPSLRRIGQEVQLDDVMSRGERFDGAHEPATEARAA